MKIINFIIFIADPGSRIRSSYFYRGSGIPDPDPLIFIADPGSRILLFLSRIRDPRSGSSYFYRGSWIPDPGSSYSIADLSRIWIRIRIQSLLLTQKQN
jgi:hypothetical protein